MASQPRFHEHRRAPRDQVSFRAALSGPQGARTTVMVVDISPLGLMARTPAAAVTGDAVTVTLPAVGPREGRVVWAVSDRIGVEFSEPVAQHGYARLLASAPHDRPNWNGY